MRPYIGDAEVEEAADVVEVGAAYAIPVLYVPLLMITHVAAFYLMMRVVRTGEVGLGRVAA